MMELRLAYDANDLSRFEKVRPHTTAIPSKHILHKAHRGLIISDSQVAIYFSLSQCINGPSTIDSLETTRAVWV